MSLLRRAREEVARHYGLRGHYSRRLDRLNRQPLFRQFVGGFPDIPCFDTREALWDHLAARIDGAVDYLELGVHAGHSILHWASVNQAPASRL